MAKDDETGVDPVSKDGEGATEDQLAARRARGGNGNGGGSAKDRAAAAEAEQRLLDEEDGKVPPAGGEEDDGQLFVWEQGRKVTLGTLIGRGIPVEHHFVFGGRRQKGSGGLMGFDETPLLIVRGKPGKVQIVPTYDEDEKVAKVAIENHVDARIVKPAGSDEGLALIAHILDEKGYVKAGVAV
jgi:hypothetical protein